MLSTFSGFVLTALAISEGVFAVPSRLDNDAHLDKRQLLKNLQVAACSAQLRLQGQAGAFCMSFVGGVKTQTSTLVVPTTSQITVTQTDTLTVAGPTDTVTYTSDTVTVILPPTATSTVTSTTATVTTTTTITQQSAGSVCDAPTPVTKRGLHERGLQNFPALNGLLKAFAGPIISSACSQYYITTPTVTATSTSTSTNTNSAFETATETLPTSTLSIPATATATEQAADVTVTTSVVATATATQGICATNLGLSCSDGKCACNASLTQSCGGVCGATVKCGSFSRSGPSYGVTRFGLTDDGKLYCGYGYGSNQGAVYYCIYDLNTPGGQSGACPSSVQC